APAPGADARTQPAGWPYLVLALVFAELHLEDFLPRSVLVPGLMAADRAAPSVVLEEFPGRHLANLGAGGRGKRVVGVWQGRPHWGPRPKRVGRSRAAAPN